MLRENSDEIDTLCEEVLITYTRFFRHENAFKAFQAHIIPEIYRQLPKNTAARVWIPGCASGDEAYSIAICFVEGASDHIWPPVQIFATDVSKSCIRRAREAQYRDQDTAGISPKRLNQFFTKSTRGCRVAPFIRKLCIFARQDLIKDPPLAHINLISCRNVLMYMDIATQEEVLLHLHYALQPGAVLFLGPSETVQRTPGLFIKAHPEHFFIKALSSSPAPPDRPIRGRLLSVQR